MAWKPDFLKEKRKNSNSALQFMNTVWFICGEYVKEPWVLSWYSCSTFRLKGSTHTTFLLIHQAQPRASKHVCFSLSPAINCCQCVNIKDECRSTFAGRCLISQLMHACSRCVNSIMMSMNPKRSLDSLAPVQFVDQIRIWAPVLFLILLCLYFMNSPESSLQTIKMQSSPVESFYCFIKIGLYAALSKW